MPSRRSMVSVTDIGKAESPQGVLRESGMAKAPRRGISGLSWQIIFFNAVALAIMIAGVLLVQSGREGLVDERMAGIRQVASIVTGTLAEYTARERTRSIDIEEAEPLLRQLIAPTNLRARLYDTDGRLAIDTRNLLSRNIVETTDLPPLGFYHRAEGWFLRIYDALMGLRPLARTEPYFEAGGNGRVYAEVRSALGGEPASARRLDRQNKLVLSVAYPVQRFRTIYGVLMVTTEGGDIDNILREERARLIGIALVALTVMVISSFYLSRAIAAPVRALAAAADRVRRGRLGRETIPVMADRNDEIGELADSLSAMTRALYARIDAIERFAADVAHELKNPLTSLKSAVEMLRRARDDGARERLMGIVGNDIGRIDRLITDISDASRLDAELSREQVRAVDLARLLEVVIEVYQLVPSRRGIRLRLELATPAHIMVLGQDERLGQVFRNLIDNAVSFSPDGGTVLIKAGQLSDRARVAVEDEGPG